MTQSQRPLKVFLCHAHADRDAVRALYTRLTKDGVDAWLDKEKLLPGQDWELEIRKAVREADVVVVCLSKQFNQAGFRQKEVRLALDTAMEKPEGEIFIIPARLEECDNLESLRKWLWVDLFEDDGYEMLMRALRARADRIGATLQVHKSRNSKESSLLVLADKNSISDKRFVEIIQNPLRKTIKTWGILNKNMISIVGFVILALGVMLSLRPMIGKLEPTPTKTSPASFETLQPQPATEPQISSLATVFTNKTDIDGLGSNHVQGVYVDNSIIYAATNNGLSVSSNGGVSFLNRTIADGLGSNNIIGVYAVNNIVYAATTKGLSISTNSGKSFVNKTTANGLGSDKINAVYALDDTIYAATDFGLSISTNGGDTFINKTVLDGLGDNLVYSVFYLDGVTYAATLKGLSISFDGNTTFVNKTTDDGLGSNVIYGVYVIDTTVYVATDSGLSISANGGNTFTNTTGFGQFTWVNGVYAAGNKVYAATLFSNGLAISKNNGASFTMYTTSDGLGSDLVYHVYVSNEAVYAATGNGLSFAPLSALSNIPDAKSLVSTIYLRLWTSAIYNPFFWV